MGKTIRAKFSKGVIKPLEEVDVADGKEVFVTIIEVPTSSKEDAFERSSGGGKGTIDVEKLIKEGLLSFVWVKIHKSGKN